MGWMEIAGQQGFSFKSDVRTTDTAQKGDTVVVKASIAAATATGCQQSKEQRC